MSNGALAPAPQAARWRNLHVKGQRSRKHVTELLASRSDKRADLMQRAWPHGTMLDLAEDAYEASAPLSK